MIYVISIFQAINAFDYTFPVCRPSVYYVPQFVLYSLDLFLFLTNGCHMIYSFQFFHVLIIETALPYLLFKKKMNDIHSYIFIQSFIHSGHEIDVRIHLLTDGQLLINHILKSCRDFFAIIFFTQYNSREISFNEELGQVHASLLYNGVI